MPQTHWGCIRDAVMRHEPVMALRCDPGKRRQKPFAYRRALRSRSRPYHRGTERCLAQSSFPAAFGGCVKPLVRGWTPLLPKNNCGDRGGREGAGTTGAHLWEAASPLAPRGGVSYPVRERADGRAVAVLSRFVDSLNGTIAAALQAERPHRPSERRPGRVRGVG